MRVDEELTKVVFRKCYNRGARQWEVVAFLPGAPAGEGNIMSYMRNGQHGEASMAFYRACRRCEPMEYEPLKRDLEKLFDYRFQIVKSVTRKLCEEAWGWRRRSTSSSRRR